MVIKKKFRIKSAHVEHLNIIEAIQNKKAKEAKKLLKEHIKDSTNRIHSVFHNKNVIKLKDNVR